MFQIGHVSLTSADTYRRDSYCLARVFQNLPAPPKHFGIFLMFFCFAKFFSNRKTWGRTWQCLLMTDFYRKVNKFFQNFAKCDPCLLEKISVQTVSPRFCRSLRFSYVKYSRKCFTQICRTLYGDAILVSLCGRKLAEKSVRLLPKH